jgi:hypothetical protein
MLYQRIMLWTVCNTFLYHCLTVIYLVENIIINAVFFCITTREITVAACRNGVSTYNRNQTEWTKLRTLERNGNQLAVGEHRNGERQRRASEEWTSQRRYHWTTGENHNNNHTKYQEYPADVQMNRIRQTPERFIPNAPSSTTSFNQHGYNERPVRDRISYRQNERGRSGAQSAKLTYCSG